MTQARLTIGIPVYDDIEGLKFTVQSLREIHGDIIPQCELLVVDNNPTSARGKRTATFLGWLARAADRDGWAKGVDFHAVKYLPWGDIPGPALAKDKVFREARTPYVLCLDSHVILKKDSLKRLLEYYEQHPDTRDLLQGPLLMDDLVAFNTHFEDIWRGGMWGTWATDPRGKGEEPFEIPAMGCGLISCRKDAWLGFNPRFREFGGEEWYIHTKFRQAGHKTLCLPWLKWWHFFRDESPTYPLKTWSKVRNYVIGHTELGLPLDRIYNHFVKGIQEDETAWQPGHREANGLTEEQWKALTANPENPPEKDPLASGNVTVSTQVRGTQSPTKQTAKCGACNKQAGTQAIVSAAVPAPAPVVFRPPPGLNLTQLTAWAKATPSNLDKLANTIRDYAAKASSVVAFTRYGEVSVFLAAGKPGKLSVYESAKESYRQEISGALTLDQAGTQYAHSQGPISAVFQAEIPECDLFVLDTLANAQAVWTVLSRFKEKLEGRILLLNTVTYGEKDGKGGPGIRPAVRRFVRENPKWTVIHSAQEQVGLMVLSCLAEDKKPLPPTWKQAVNAAKASWRTGKLVPIEDGVLKDTPIQEMRLSECLFCPSLTNGACSECGCPVLKRTSHPEMSCPLGKWQTVE